MDRITFFSLFSFDILLDDLENLAVILKELFIPEVALCYFFYFFVYAFPVKGFVHDIQDQHHLLLGVIFL